MDRMEGYAWGTWWFLQGLGWVYLLAFLSAHVQIIPLVGEEGLMPLRDMLQQWRAYGDRLGWGWSLYRRMPTLAWWNPTDHGLQWMSWAGMIGSVMLIFRIAPRYVLIALWILYLSLVRAGQTFFAFQWDNLLIETGFLAIWIAPASWRPGFFRLHEPPRIARWLLYWLIFRLMFFSGIAKFQSGDSAWRDLTALSYHYETQPLPTIFAWYAHQLPLWLHKIATASMFWIEVIVPFFLFSPAMRRIAAMSFLLLMLVIGLHGNYGYFNLLTAALALLLLDDRFFSELLPASVRRPFVMTPPTQRTAFTLLPLAFVAALILVVSGLQSLSRAWGDAGNLLHTTPILSWVGPFRTVNRYHLFPVMTKQRPEIMLQGSEDGRVWKDYRFKYKPDRPEKAPSFAFFHMPRLDWQLWFAALAPHRTPSWLRNLLLQLRTNHPHALSLLAHNPFHKHPPRYVRAVLHDCRFSDPYDKQQSAAWWRCIPLRILRQM